MADKVRERNDKMAEKIVNNPVPHRPVPEIIRVEEPDRQSLHPNQVQGAMQPPRKKTSSFQITSVTVAAGSRLSNDGGDDSADDLDESHTEDISSELVDVSKTTDLDNDYSSEDAFSSSVDLTPAPAVLPAMPPNNGQGDGSQVPVSTVTDEDQPDNVIQWQNRFRVVKIESTEPFKRGRWICMDFLDPPQSLTDTSEKEGGSGNSSTASSVHYGESYIEIPICQEMAYQPSDSQQIYSVPVQSHHQTTSTVDYNASAGLVSGQNQPQSLAQGISVGSDYSNQSVASGHGQNVNMSAQHQGQSLPQHTAVQSGILPNQHMQVHHGGSLPAPLQSQPNSIPQGEYYNVHQPGNNIGTSLNQTEFQGPPLHSNLPQGDYVNMPQHGGGMHNPDYVQSVHSGGSSVPPGMMPGDYVTSIPSQVQQGDYAQPPCQSEYVGMHQPGSDYMGVHQQTSVQPVMSQSEYIHQQGSGIPQGMSHPQGTMPPSLSQSVHQQGAPLPQGDYSIHQPGPPISSEYSHVHPPGTAGLPAQGSGVPSNITQSSVHPQSTNQGNVPLTGVTSTIPTSQNIPSTVVNMNEYVSVSVGQNGGTPTQQSISATQAQQPPSANQDQQSYSSLPSSRPSTITLTSNSGEASQDLTNSVTITPPMLENLTIANKEGDDTESASGSSTVAIDNKIEQAMDLVKSHLMFAVREEVDVLKEKITELMDRINQLEYENSILRANASQETLAKLSQPPPNPQPPNPSS